MMDGCVVFSDVVTQVVWARLPIVAKFFCAMRQRSQCSFMSIDLSPLLVMLLVTTLSAVVLSVCIGVGGCLWPMVSNAWRAGIASLQLMKRYPNSASAAEDMTAFMICEMVRTGPLFGGTAESSYMKNALLPCLSLSILTVRKRHYR